MRFLFTFSPEFNENKENKDQRLMDQIYRAVCWDKTPPTLHEQKVLLHESDEELTNVIVYNATRSNSTPAFIVRQELAWLNKAMTEGVLTLVRFDKVEPVINESLHQGGYDIYKDQRPNQGFWDTSAPGFGNSVPPKSARADWQAQSTHRSSVGADVWPINSSGTRFIPPEQMREGLVPASELEALKHENRLLRAELAESNMKRGKDENSFFGGKNKEEKDAASFDKAKEKE